MNSPNPSHIKDDNKTCTDAVHHRFREQNPKKVVWCLSCNKSFMSRSMMEIFEHYQETNHKTPFGACLYCGGNVYEYRIENTLKKFHNCGRSKRGLE